MDHEGRPTWLTEPCPEWCTRPHHRDDHEDDRRHQDHRELTVQVATDPVPGTLASSLDLVVALDRPLGRSATWIRLEDREHRQPRVAVTPASARRLAALLVACADLAEADLT